MEVSRLNGTHVSGRWTEIAESTSSATLPSGGKRPKAGLTGVADGLLARDAARKTRRVKRVRASQDNGAAFVGGRFVVADDANGNGRVLERFFGVAAKF